MSSAAVLQIFLAYYVLLFCLTCVASSDECEAQLAAAQQKADAAAANISAANILNCSAAGLARNHASNVVTLERLSTYTPSSVAVHALWWSRKRQAIPVTVFSTVTTNKLEALRDFCLAWKGPLSVAIYAPIVLPASASAQPASPGVRPLSPQDVEHLQLHMQEFARLHEELEGRPDACQLDALLAYEFVEERVSANAYPINNLRNLAMLQVGNG